MLREATARDLDFLFALYMHPDINRWLLYEDMPMETFRPIATDLIARHALFIFEQEGRPVGMCKLVPQKYGNDHIIYLGGVAIDPGEKGKGLGARMLEEAIQICKERGCTRIELTVAVENTQAIRLYERLGFAREGIPKNYTYLKKEGKFLDEQVMALILL